MENIQISSGNKRPSPGFRLYSLKRRIFHILESDNQSDPVSKSLNSFLVSLIAINILAVIIETVDSIRIEYKTCFDLLELFSVIVFTIEYLLRIWICSYFRFLKKNKFPRIAYMSSPMAIIDLLSILPFFLSIFTSVDLRYITVLRLVRLLRIFKLGRYSIALRTLFRVIKDKRAELVITFLSILVLLILASSLMYLIENKAQPDVFSSIPATMWWGVATLTTVGYGDIYPITPLGKLLGGIIAILGIGMFALPAGLISSSFTEQIQRSRKRPKCPHCGRTIVNLNNNHEH